MVENIVLLTPNWPAPKNVRAVCSTRSGGSSSGAYASLNLGTHVADSAEHVLANRLHYQQLSQMPAAPVWLNQVHGTDVVELFEANNSVITADASVTSAYGVVSTVMSADCLPILLCNNNGSRVASVHAGWRGLCNGIIENTLAHFAQPADIMAYLGPAIGPTAFEVGPEVRDAFILQDTAAKLAFTNTAKAKWLANLYLLARQRLAQCGVTQIYGGNYCTYQQESLFFSYRRDGQTGRMASSIWLT